MSDKPKRPWFRFHLLTAVLMMVAAGVVMWLNVVGRPKPDFPFPGFSDVKYTNGCPYAYGWPLAGVVRAHDNYKPDGNSGAWVGVGEPRYIVRYPAYVAADLGVALLILIVICFLSEWLLRRREGRKP